MIRRSLFALCALVAPQLLIAAPSIGLQNGQTESFAIPGGSFSTSYYIDITDASAQLQLDLDNTGTGDTDLMLRYGTPFADQTSNGGAVPDFDLFLRYAHFRGISPSGDETLYVQKSGNLPLRSGRWFIAVINGTNASQNVRLTATLRTTVPQKGIEFVFDRPGSGCDTAPWNDATTVAPIDGNSGTTLGQQRRNAMLRAGELLSAELRSPVSVKVRACWEAQGGSPSEGATIAYAGPTTFVFDGNDFPTQWLPEKYTWYSITEVVRLGGTRQCSAVANDCNAPDIEATFNSDLDPPRNVLNAPFYYGYTGASKPQRSIDFISTTMHELTHGLGFVGLVNVDATDGPLGTRASTQSGESYDDVFSKNLVAVNTQDRTYKPFLGTDTSDAERGAALVSQDGLRWSGMEAVMSTLNQKRDLPMPDNFPLMFAPCDRNNASDPCGTQPGSTLSHTVQPGDLMNAYDSGESNRAMGLALPMLNAMGWSNATQAPRTFVTPVAGNWFDRTRSGHGIDLQLYQRDAVNGDLYFVIFYTFEPDNRPEYYLGLGRLIDGVFVGAKQGNGISLMRIRYDAANRRGELDTTSAGELLIDFNQAEASPACRSANRNGAGKLALMQWSIRSESGKWCMEPAVLPESHTSPDFSGHWFGGNADPGWGMELLSLKGPGTQPLLVAIVYFPDNQGRSRWAATPVSTVNLADTQTLVLNEVSSGFCRTCAPPSGTAQLRPVGTIKFKLTQPTRTEPPSGANRVTVDIAIPGVADFHRSDVPLTLLSTPPGS